MLIAITCPQCGHRGVIAKRKLPRILACAHCGRRHRFEASEARALTTTSSVDGPTTLYERALSNDNLLGELWGDW